MGLEVVTYVSDLVVTNPVGATDPKSQGDDHLRAIKTALKNTLPNLTGAMNATQAELNRLVGVTGVTGTGNLALSASPTFTGTLTAATVAATTLTGAGSGITALNATNLASGTVPDARFPATLPALSGVNLTALNATQLTSGTVPDARLSSNVPLINAANVYTAGTQTIQANGANLVINGSDTAGGWLSFYTSGTRRSYAGRGTLISGGAVADLALVAANGGLWFSGNDGVSSHFRLSSAGVLTTPNASAGEVGFKGVPFNVQNATYGLVLADAGGYILHTSGSAHTYTIPANGSVAYPVGTVLTFANVGAGVVTIAITTDTLRLAGAGTTGSRSLAQYGVASALKVGSDEWLISGPGLS